MKISIRAASGAVLLLAALAGSPWAATQDASTTPSTKPTEHLIGTITALDATARTITVKEDKSGSEQTILLADTKTLIKVAPGAKDLKNATRITADQLAAGDRVDIRGFKSAEDPGKVAARSVVLMSARELQQAHQAQAAEWQRSMAGVVTALDPSTGKITINQGTASGPKPVIVETSAQTEFTRYSPQTPGSPAVSQLVQVQPGDQLRVIGEKSADGSTITAQRVYSGAFRTLNGTIVSVAPDGKQLTMRDLGSKKPVEILLTESSSLRKLPREMAMVLARRLSPTAQANSGVPNGGSENAAMGAGTPSAGAPGAGGMHGPGAGGMRGGRNGDISQMIDHLPKIEPADLKPGDAIVVSGVATGRNNDQLTATNVIAGVEPILRSAPARQGGQALGGDWGLGEMAPPQ